MWNKHSKESRLGSGSRVSARAELPELADGGDEQVQMWL